MTLSSVFQPIKPDLRRSMRALDLVLHRLWADTKQELFAPMLLHTLLFYLVCCGADLVLVAEVTEHERLETTRRYSLAS